MIMLSASDREWKKKSLPQTSFSEIVAAAGLYIVLCTENKTSIKLNFSSEDQKQANKYLVVFLFRLRFFFLLIQKWHTAKNKTKAEQFSAKSILQ